MRIAVPDLISNSYFPAVAAVELGFFKEEGIDATVELLFPVPKTMEALRDGTFDFVAGSAHATLHAFPEWRGAKLLAALAQRMYWKLVLRGDLGAGRGDLQILRGMRIGAAPGPDAGLRRLLVEAGIDPEREASRRPWKTASRSPGKSRRSSTRPTRSGTATPWRSPPRGSSGGSTRWKTLRAEP